MIDSLLVILVPTLSVVLFWLDVKYRRLIRKHAEVCLAAAHITYFHGKLNSEGLWEFSSTFHRDEALPVDFTLHTSLGKQPNGMCLARLMVEIEGTSAKRKPEPKPVELEPDIQEALA